MKHGEEIKTFSLSAWINAVAWSPSNKFVFIASHDSILTIYNIQKSLESSISLIHSPISHIIPISDSSILTIGYDRNIYQYECDSNETWSLKKSLTKDSVNPLLSANSSEGSMSIHDRVKQLTGGLQKKQSLIVTSAVQRNIHSCSVNSANLFGSTLITSDYAGFVKMWNF